MSIIPRNIKVASIIISYKICNFSLFRIKKFDKNYKKNKRVQIRMQNLGDNFSIIIMPTKETQILRNKNQLKANSTLHLLYQSPV